MSLKCTILRFWSQHETRNWVHWFTERTNQSERTNNPQCLTLRFYHTCLTFGRNSAKIPTGPAIHIRSEFNPRFCHWHGCLLGCRAWQKLTLTMEVLSNSETSVSVYQTARRNSPEDSRLHTRSRENLKSHFVMNVEYLRSVAEPQSRSLINHIISTGTQCDGFLSPKCGYKMSIGPTFAWKVIPCWKASSECNGIRVS
jgi:hypothetical protein